MIGTPLIAFVTIPWNSTAVLGAVDAVLLVALARRLRWWHGAILGLAVAWTYSSRYTDAIFVGIAALTVLLARGALRPRAGALRGLVAAAVIGVLPTLLLQRAAFGSPFTTPYGYLKNIGTAQFDIGDIPWHAAQDFLSPFFFGTGAGIDQPALLTLMFLTVLTPFGWLIAVRRSAGGRRTLTVGISAAAALSALFYCAFYFTSPYGLQFGSLHFFKPWWPLWTVAAVLAVAEGGRWLLARRTGR
jgi:hypothetical protein